MTYLAVVGFEKSAKITGLVEFRNIKADSTREATAKARKQFRQTHGYMAITDIDVVQIH